MKEFLKGHRRESLETLLFGLDLGYLETLFFFFKTQKGIANVIWFHKLQMLKGYGGFPLALEVIGGSSVGRVQRFSSVD